LLTALVAQAVLLGPGVALAAEPDVPPQANTEVPAAPRFDVFEYRVLGNSTLPAVEVERAVYAHLGPGKSLDDVEQARAALELAYHAAGYGTVFVDIPEQQVNSGIVRLRVAEGRLDRIRITGSRYFSNGRIRAAVPALASGAVPRLPEIQEQLAALNRISGDRQVSPVLKAGRMPGTVDVELKVKDDLPLHGNVQLNDRYTADTSRTRLSASVSFDNLFQRHHSLSLQYQSAPEDPAETRAIVGSYVLRTERLPDTTFALFAVDSKSDVAALGTLSVIGNGRIFGARAIHNLPGSSDFFQSATYGVDYKDFLEDIRLDADEGLVTPIDYLNWMASYSATQVGEVASNSYNLGLNLGIRGLVNSARQFADKRFRGRASYVFLRGGWTHQRRLTDSWQLVGRMAAQYSPQPLVNNEQFAIGGMDTVRGYLESTLLGDYGAAATLELRYGGLSRWLRLSSGSAYGFVFADAGLARLHDPLPEQDSRFHLGSAGLGMRISGWNGLSLGLDGAVALAEGGSVDSGDLRLHFDLQYQF
jgi:hemolysin activation/secretion protein